MRSLLSGLVLACLAAPAIAQPALSVSANPYDGSGDAPLVIRNVGPAPVSIDSIAFRGSDDAPGYLVVFVVATREVGGQTQTAGLDCGFFRLCRSVVTGAPDLGTLATAEALSLVIGGYCGRCRSAGGVSETAADTMLFYYAGLSTPLRVLVTGYRQSVAGEPSPGASRLELSVSPSPVAALGTVRLTLEAPALTATASVLDALGRRVAVLHDGPLAAGPHDFAFDASALTPGAYVVRFVTDGSAASRVVTVVR